MKHLTSLFIFAFAACLTGGAGTLDVKISAPAQGAVISQHTQAQDDFDKLNYKEIQKLRKAAGGDLTQPKEISCAWSGTALKNARIEVAETPDFKTGLLSYPAADGAASANIHSLKTGTTYYLRIAAEGKYSAAQSFTTKAEAPRWIKVDGVSNVRDCGGWVTKSGKRIRQGIFYRGGEMNRHMTIAPAGIDFLTNVIGLHTLIDIRSAAEIKKAGKGSMLPASVRWINLPLTSYDAIFKPGTQKQYAKIFRILLDEKNLPAYLHCFGGADRTGTIIFMLNALLGAKDEDLLHDYELTTLSRWGQRSRDSKQFKPFLAKLDELAPGKDFETKAKVYFKQAGITDAEIDALKAIFLEK